jgi:hypothetical protein
VWKPTLASAGIIAGAETDERGRPRYQTTMKERPQQLRHYYASIMLHGGVSIKELAEYLGHHDRLSRCGFTVTWFPAHTSVPGRSSTVACSGRAPWLTEHRRNEA